MITGLGDFFKSLRWFNLLITGITLMMVYFLIMVPVHENLSLGLHLSYPDLVLLILSTVLIMAGGYVINDVMDRDTDLINEKFIGAIPISTSLIGYGFMSVVGLVLAAWLCDRVGDIQYWWIFMGSFISLLTYAYYLKGMPLLGNITIGLLCALVPAVPVVLEQQSFFALLDPQYVMVNFLVLFAFILTIIRELVKDMEDYDGDEATDTWTFPVLFGLEAAKWTAFIFILMFLLLLSVLIYYFLLESWISLMYLIGLTLVPILILAFRLIKAEDSVDYQNISRGLKLVMSSGLVYIIVYYFEFL